MKRETIIKGLKELVKKGWEINEEEGTIKNPETGRSIKIKTALSYDPSHPAYKLAKKQSGDSGEEDKEYDSSGETDYFEYYEDLPDNIDKLMDKYFMEEPTFDYDELSDIRDEFKQQGWTFDVGLDGDPIDLRPLRDDEKTSSEEPKSSSSEKPKKERPEEAPKRPEDMDDDEHSLEDFREFGNSYSDDMTPEQKDEYDNLTGDLESANANLIGAQEDGNDQDFEDAAAEYNEIESKLYDLIDSIYEPENDSSMEYDEFDNSLTFGDGEKVKVDYDGDFQYKDEWFNVNDYENEDELKQAIADKVGSKNENTSMKISRSRLREIVKEVIKEESDYQEFFKRALEKTGKSIPQMSDEEKKAFFNKIDKAWKGKGEKNEGNAFGAAVTKAKEQGKDTFKVGGKTYKVKESVVNERNKPKFKVGDMVKYKGAKIPAKVLKVMPSDGENGYLIQFQDNKKKEEAGELSLVKESVVNERRTASKPIKVDDDTMVQIVGDSDNKRFRELTAALNPKTGKPIQKFGFDRGNEIADTKDELIKKLQKKYGKSIKFESVNEQSSNRDIMAISRMTGVPDYKIEDFVRKHKLKDLKKVKKLVKGMGSKKDERFAQIVGGKFSMVSDFKEKYKNS